MTSLEAKPDIENKVSLNFVMVDSIIIVHVHIHVCTYFFCFIECMSQRGLEL